ncbi:hypothetical protein [Mycoplasma sp. 1654_15]|uniref:hypothetical protein n=1 Tax=Mycoplasma sp. 1654_15 TaxID=2725994 RepID=UPI001449A3A2|nr:hypothetical protein [Mycoplasma sp. 1654_15]QJB71260.1 hypothetical protein HF996_02075 [Mycoplasma sp. 1654_15]
MLENDDKVKEFLTNKGKDAYPSIKKKYQDGIDKADEDIAQAQKEMDNEKLKAAEQLKMNARLQKLAALFPHLDTVKYLYHYLYGDK